jgi:hypothetical protein
VEIDFREWLRKGERGLYSHVFFKSFFKDGTNASVCLGIVMSNKNPSLE